MIFRKNNTSYALLGWTVFFALALLGFSASVLAQDETNAVDDTKMLADAIIETQFGNIELKLFPEVAPQHVQNFLKLANTQFYDGTLFHRVIPGFMIQGGDPNSKEADRNMHGTGGPGYSIKAEFNDMPHKRGTLSMARSSDPNSAGSQFFIVVKTANFLDGQYTVFGQVINGMDVADQIVMQERDNRDNPLEPVPMKIHVTKTAVQ